MRLVFQPLLNLFNLLDNHLKAGSQQRISLSASYKNADDLLIFVVRSPDMVVLVVTHHPNYLGCRVFFVWDAACHHFPHQYPETIHIRRAFVFTAFQNLGCHPMRSAHSDIFVLLLVFGGIDARESKVAKFYIQILINEQIRAF